MFARLAAHILLLLLLWCSALNRISPRGVSFLDQSTLIREKLAEQLEKEEAWSKAAQVLAGIDLDSGGLFCSCGCAEWLGDMHVCIGHVEEGGAGAGRHQLDSGAEKWTRGLIINILHLWLCRMAWGYTCLHWTG
jgi:hypothetical protein